MHGVVFISPGEVLNKHACLRNLSKLIFVILTQMCTEILRKELHAV